ncbi:ABC transporter ATP-binding protein [Hypericibacter adhaerens]|uniref:ABC transporter ATP-binding protein n=1 Tax=Hypericibacter adhaerens TaxID=2602016 RepID=A0A5J6N4R0_9PROT|nr:sn-glycerol-3-phosphate ABC transporter ATP-binding protein UgpC [Hypericibacter adhaerens]QEX24414.1 ABC transporter ATP-binding protein [Hypericibacter adhaerens]
MASVEIVDIRKNYGALEVLHGINVSIASGEFIVLVGPSGCGKSTLLRMIAGLEEITVGDIRIDGQVVNEVPPKDRDIAMVFQSYALYPHMTVRNNMSFSLRMRGASRERIDRGVADAANVLALESLLERFPRQLSGGQRQRVAMGRAIVRQPKVFLFDEPLSNLDAKLRVLMRTEIKALHQRLGTTSIYVTHDQLEAMTMADRIVVLQDGRIEQVGPPLDLYDRPANRFVAGFIGSPAMNFIPGILNPANGGWAVEANGATLAVGSAGKARQGQKVMFGIRPEHLEVVAPAAGIAAEVEVVEPTGASTFVFTQIAATPVCAALNDRRLPRPGDRIGLAPQPDRIHLFDAETGIRLND